ncbi:carboxymuconolactone decarboxylase family protein [Entomomonas asaccharolytica]|uniref:Peroxidase-related enzyme n=1 Tax=Entomomonas asaccharolytica TaxID=2785331 RepID=A0A974ND94_9GAMM|nr:peroxidase-related enzyme [Entomomonas asaccharolytica]QQP84464.1 peroxidase-related enzyme [Entomomonas asaccharolytica]
MTRFTIPADINAAPEQSREMLEAVNKKLGKVPNLYRLVALSPEALTGYVSLSGALAKGKLHAKTREAISLALAELNGCAYCLSAHSYISKNLMKVDDAEIAANRNGTSTDEKNKAAIEFAVKVAEKKGKVSAQDLQNIHEHGYSEAEIIEIVQNVALNIWTNYMNNVAETEVDFPPITPK